MRSSYGPGVGLKKLSLSRGSPRPFRKPLSERRPSSPRCPTPRRSPLKETLVALRSRTGVMPPLALAGGGGTRDAGRQDQGVEAAAAGLRRGREGHDRGVARRDGWRIMHAHSIRYVVAAQHAHTGLQDGKPAAGQAGGLERDGEELRVPGFERDEDMLVAGPCLVEQGSEGSRDRRGEDDPPQGVPEACQLGSSGFDIRVGPISCRSARGEIPDRRRRSPRPAGFPARGRRPGHRARRGRRSPPQWASGGRRGRSARGCGLPSGDCRTPWGCRPRFSCLSISLKIAGEIVAWGS
jgi:hypothetical protein